MNGDHARQDPTEAERLSTIGSLVGGVAHELNNPLSSVLGFAELCAASPAAPPELREHLGIIRDEAKRAARIVRNLIEFARARRPERAMTQLNDLIRRVTDLVAYDMRSSRVRLERQLADHLPNIMGDPGRLQQLVFVLLQAARRACEEKGAEGRVRISTRASGDRVTISVEDSGPGIPSAVAVCRAIVDEHHGAIRGVERPGHGATVFVELPAIGDVKPDEKLEPPHGLSILVIDPDSESVASLRGILGDSNTFASAKDAAEALAALRETKFNLVVTDMRLPGLSGRELYRFIVREKPDLTDRVVFTLGTSSEDTDDFMRDLRIPAIAKPFAARDVLRAVTQAINGPG